MEINGANKNLIPLTINIWINLNICMPVINNIDSDHLSFSDIFLRID